MKKLFYQNGMTADLPIMSPVKSKIDDLHHLASLTLISCGEDELYQQGIAYCNLLREAGVQVTFKEFPSSTHGFMETNSPEYKVKYAEEQIIERQKAFLFLSMHLKNEWKTKGA